MFENLDILRMSFGLTRHAAARQAAIAENVAHVNTPGYKQVDVQSFAALHGSASPDLGLRATRAGHFDHSVSMAPPAPQIVRAASTSPNGNSVSLETEIMKAAETRQSHDMALSVYQSTLSILRTSIGRR